MPAGKLLCFEGTVEDITQRVLDTRHRQEAERRLQESETLYHSLVETLPQNIFRKGLDGRFTFANQQFCKAIGKTLTEIVGKTDADFFPAALAQKYQADDHKVTRNRPAVSNRRGTPASRPAQTIRAGRQNPAPRTRRRGHRPARHLLGHHRATMTEEKNRRVTQLLAENRRALRARHQEMTEDLKMAREIQLSMLPQQYPSFPSPSDPSRSAFLFTHRYIPTGTVGGDFFSISALSETEAGVFICDVAGHGVRAALVTAMIRALVEELKTVAVNPGEFLTRLNRDMQTMLRPTGTPLLTTAFYMVADSKERRSATPMPVTLNPSSSTQTVRRCPTRYRREPQIRHLNP